MRQISRILLCFTLVMGLFVAQPTSVSASADSAPVAQSVSISTFNSTAPTIKVKSSTSLTLSWDELSGATSYRIYRCTTKSGTYSKVATVYTESYVDSYLTSGKTYYYYVVAYKGSTKKATSLTRGYAALATPSITVTTSSKNARQRVRWDAIKGATGYRVYVSSDVEPTYKMIAETSELTYLYEDTEPGVTYSYKVKAYKTNSTGNIYGKSSSVVSKFLDLNTSEILSFTTTDYGKLTIEVSPVKKATAYRIYRSNTKNGTYTYIGQTTSTTYIDSSFTPGPAYYYKVKPYHTNSVTGKRYYGVYSEYKKGRCTKFMTSKGYEALRIDGAWWIDGVLIANKSYALNSSYGDGLTEEFTKYWKKMKKAASADGVSLSIQSGYRDYALQKYLYNRYCAQDGKAEADTYSARPGHSEHQSGLAADLNWIDQKFEKTAAFKWLQKHCWEYGFILRYPKGKTNETGYIYEPWHYRYVGVELAKKLYNNGNWITMEDYYGIPSEYNN